MSQYIVSARKYRPATFDSVVGQQALTSTLKNAIATDRLAHAYLFCGSRGVGKTSCARIFAKTINCEHRTASGEACNECDSCRAFNEGNSFNIVEMDAASNNGVDDMRSLTDQVQMPPTRGRYRVFIIDEVHMLSSAAFNAFLKTLEEPPSFVIFILATTEKHKIIPTILSRCQIFDFNRITVPDMVAHLAKVAANEGISAEGPALNVIARQADGAMRDALSIFDQVAASSRGNITYKSTIENLNVLDSSYYASLVESFRKCDVPQALLTFHEIRRKGFDAQFFLGGLGQYLRDLMLASSASTIGLIDAPDDERKALAATAAGLKPEFLYAAMGLCNDADLNYRQSGNKQLLVELTLIRIAQLLSPSPVKKSGQGEGPLKAIPPVKGSQATAAPSQTAGATPQPAAHQAPAPVAQTPNAMQAPAAEQRRAATPTASAPPRTGSAFTGTVVRTATGNAIPVMNMKSTAKTAANEIRTAAPKTRTSPFKQENLTGAWLSYAALHNKENALVTAMHSSQPKLSGGNICVEVTKATLPILQESLDNIIRFLREKLDNDSVVIDFVQKGDALEPKYWNDTQVVNHLLENAEFKEFYDLLKLTLL